MDFVLLLLLIGLVDAYSALMLPSAAPLLKPTLILISGPTGVGKSTFAMNVAIHHGILTCISTDFIRGVLRSALPNHNNNMPLHRSTYVGSGDPIKEWKECCHALDAGIEHLIRNSLRKGASLVMEGVHLIPSNRLLHAWRKEGGHALGCLLSLKDAETHRNLIIARGRASGKGAEGQLRQFHRIRAIQEEMIRLAKIEDWIEIPQLIHQTPLDQINAALNRLELPIETNG